MKTEDAGKKTRPGWMPNLFDILIIAVVIVVAVLLLWWRGVIGGAQGSADDPAGVSSTVRYTMEFTQMTGDTAYLIQPGDALVDSVRKYEVGSVVSVDVTDAFSYAVDVEEGGYVRSPVPGAKNAVIVVESPCTQSEREILVGGGYPIRCGLPVQIKGPGYAGTGTILSIERGTAQTQPAS